MYVLKKNIKNICMIILLFDFLDTYKSTIGSFLINANDIQTNTTSSMVDYEINFEHNQEKLKRRIRTRTVRIRRTRKTPRTTKSSLSSAKCGIPIVLSTFPNSPLNRIINGYTTNVFSWPWIASIQDQNKDHICAATIISKNHLLSAAHCVSDHDFVNYTIKIGIDQLNQVKDENIFQIDKVFIHPDYDDKLKNDLAIIKLKKDIEYSSVSRPICLPDAEKGNFPLNRNVVVIGWGSTTGNRPANSINLQKTVLRVINQQTDSECSKLLKDLYCALDPSPKKSNICYGDSGGPMMIFHDNSWFLYGISNFLTGFNHSKCDNTRPSYYANITNYLDWIHFTLRL